MIRLSKLASTWVLVAAVLSAALLSGCGRGDGPERVVVSGTVTYRGQPLEKGQIQFFPAQGTKAPMAGAEIVAGKYKVDAKGGVPVGTHRVEILALRPAPLPKNLPPEALDQGVPMQQYIPAKYNAKSELELTIAPGSRPVAKDFSLTD